MSIDERIAEDTVRLYWHESGRPGGPVLLLLHGLGANGAVWDGVRDLAEKEWPGPIIVPDLRGHGRSSRAAVYTYGHFASDLASIVSHGAETHVLGHSMGGAIGVLLANGTFGIDVRSVLGVGVKLVWSEDDVAMMAKVAERGHRRFESADEAARAALKIAGLGDLAEQGAGVADAGVHGTDDGTYELSWDNRTYMIGPFPMARLLRARADTAVTFSRGEHDHVVSSSDISSLGCEPVDIPGMGHNVHVESPGAVWDLFTRLQGS